MLMDGVVLARTQFAANLMFRGAAFDFSVQAKANRKAMSDRLFFGGFAYRVFRGKTIELDHA
jgi:cytochrome bd-type quinol oxidase subunit 2